MPTVGGNLIGGPSGPGYVTKRNRHGYDATGRAWPYIGEYGGFDYLGTPSGYSFDIRANRTAPNTATTFTVTASRTSYVPFFISYPVTISQIGCHTAAAASGLLGISGVNYNDAVNLGPGDVLATTGTVALAAGAVQVPLAYSLDVGWYFAAIGAGATGFSVASVAQQGLWPYLANTGTATAPAVSSGSTAGPVYWQSSAAGHTAAPAGTWTPSTIAPWLTFRIA